MPELDGRDLICDRLLDEAGWLRQCAGWLTCLHAREFPRWSACAPEAIIPARRTWWPAWPRVAAILPLVAADAGELARARRVAGLGAAAAGPGRRAGSRAG